MVRIDAFETDEAGGIPIYPWINAKPDPTKLTGGDMYQILLSASLGFKSIHGANTSPTCEVLSIVHRADGNLDGCGIIRWDPRPDDVIPDRLGDDISDVFYRGKPYRGSVTKVGSVMAYESGLWEPSVRKRAKATAFLAAAINAHGRDRGEAAQVVSRIAGDSIDVEAVESALLPASHLKREMAMISKANHRIFSRGTIQCGISWDDSALGFRERKATMAFDWGRVTALARSIAEANIQNCANFRALASSAGIPFTIVRNSWAYVSSLDYYLTLERVSSVPIIKAVDFGVPSLAGTFVGHETDILLALNRTLVEGEDGVKHAAFQAYQDLYRKARERVSGRKGRQIHRAHTAQEVSLSSHLITAENVTALARVSKLVYDSYLKAIANRRHYDKRLKSAIHSYLNPTDNIDRYTRNKLLDNVSRQLFAKPTWVLAQSIISDALQATEGLSEDDLEVDLGNAMMQLNVTKQTLAGYPTHITTELTYTTSVLEKLGKATVEHLKATEGIDPEISATQRSLVDLSVRQSISALGQLSVKGVELLEKLRDSCSVIYRAWFEDASKAGPIDFTNAATKWLFTSFALEGLEIGDCMNKESGYLDGTRPRSSYVYQCVKALGRYYGIDVPGLKRLIYPDALKIAQELDESGKFPFSVEAGVVYTTTVLDQVVGNMMIGEIHEPISREYDDLYAIYHPNDSPVYGEGIMEEAEFEETFKAMMAGVEDEFAEMEMNAYESCLNTYPDKALADKYADAHGFRNFKEAFETLGDDAGYYEGSTYVEEARGKIAKRRIEHSEPSPQKKFRSLI